VAMFPSIKPFRSWNKGNGRFCQRESSRPCELVFKERSFHTAGGSDIIFADSSHPAPDIVQRVLKLVYIFLSWKKRTTD
jgi:hypothetical protein